MPDPDSRRYLALKALMMPRDTNPQGTIFGGVLLSFIDQAGAVGAHYAIRELPAPTRSLVTVAMNSVEFHEPCLVGDLVSFWTELVRVGRTSITIHVTVETDRPEGMFKLTQADVTYVAVEMQEGRRRPIAIRGE